jgi:hypothetical protein
MPSFIIPAHNEEPWIGKVLGSIRTTMEKLDEPYQVIASDLVCFTALLVVGCW